MLFVFAAPFFFAASNRSLLVLSRPQRRTSATSSVTLALLWIAGCVQQTASAATDLIDLRPVTPIGSCRRVKAVVEVEGNLKLNADGKEVQHLPLKVQAELEYSERVLSHSTQWAEYRLARSYGKADAHIRLRDSDLKNQLRADRQLIVAEAAEPGSATLFSPQGPLTREELELVQVPAAGLPVEALLPLRVLKVGGQWALGDATVTRLLGLEAVSQQDVACTLNSMEDNLAIVSLAGKVTGAVGGVSSDIELKGKLNYDLKQRAVTWLTLAYKEERAVGHAQPGFEVVTTLKLVAAPCRPIAELDSKAIAKSPLKTLSQSLSLELQAADAGFHLIHDRRWSVMFDRPDTTVLRFVDRGDLVAQCNVSPRPALGPQEQLTLEGFQADVKRVLGKNFEQIVEASEETTDSNLRILRIVVAGKAGDLNIQWMYYHLSNDQGRRASFVFTIESTLLERFKAIDRDLIDGFSFTAERQPKAAARPATSAPADGPSLR
jgi:hypothetical protein